MLYRPCFPRQNLLHECFSLLNFFLPYHIGGQTALLDRGQVYKPELSHEKH